MPNVLSLKLYRLSLLHIFAHLWLLAIVLYISIDVYMFVDKRFVDGC